MEHKTQKNEFTLAPNFLKLNSLFCTKFYEYLLNLLLAKNEEVLNVLKGRDLDSESGLMGSYESLLWFTLLMNNF
jgi:hypothetical protein